jgi:hypothetical protein
MNMPETKPMTDEEILHEGFDTFTKFVEEESWTSAIPLMRAVLRYHRWVESQARQQGREEGEKKGREEEKKCNGALLARLAALPADHPNHAAVHREAINAVHSQAEEINRLLDARDEAHKQIVSLQSRVKELEKEVGDYATVSNLTMEKLDLQKRVEELEAALKEMVLFCNCDCGFVMIHKRGCYVDKTKAEAVKIAKAALQTAVASASGSTSVRTQEEVSRDESGTKKEARK